MVKVDRSPLSRPVALKLTSRRPCRRRGTAAPPAALHDPARLGGKLKKQVEVHDYGGSISLASYMQLPAEQYDALDPTLIQPLGGNRFRLQVPRLALFNVWVQPTVDVAVTNATGPPPRVLLQGERCKLDGSPLVQRMHLDQRFELHFQTQLTWTSGSEGPSTPSPRGKGSITADLDVEVFTEVIPPFDLLPRSVLEGTCNAVLRTLIGTLLPVFLGRLSADYERWANSPAYRAQRQQHQQPAA